MYKNQTEDVLMDIISQGRNGDVKNDKTPF